MCMKNETHANESSHKCKFLKVFFLAHSQKSALSIYVVCT